jgi:hypothetical protein
MLLFFSLFSNLGDGWIRIGFGGLKYRLSSRLFVMIDDGSATTYSERERREDLVLRVFVPSVVAALALR